MFGTTAFGQGAQQQPGLFGTVPSVPQQQQQSAFGFGSQPAQTSTPFGAPAQQQPATNLFGTPQSTQQAPSLFATPTTQQQQSASLFGTPTLGATSQPGGSLLVSTTQAPTNLFGQQQQAPSLFGAPGQTSVVGGLGGNVATTATSLFGTAATTASNPLFATQISQPSLFGQQTLGAPTSTMSSGITTAAPSLFGASQPTSAFGSQPLSLGKPAIGGLFPGTTQSQPIVTTTAMSSLGAPALSALSKPGALNSPEVPQVLVDQLQELRKKIKENYDRSYKMELNEAASPVSDSILKANNLIKTAKSSNGQIFSDAKDFFGKVNRQLYNCKALTEVNKQKKLHPGQTSEHLCQLLSKVGTDLLSNVERLSHMVYQLEVPLREYKFHKDNGTEPTVVGKQELMEYVERLVTICDVALLSSSSLHDRVEEFKAIYIAQLRQLYGPHAKSPFKTVSQETSAKSSDLFEYDPSRGMKASNIFPSSASLMSFVESVQKSAMQQPQPQQQSSFLGFGGAQPQPTVSSSLFGGQRPAPFSLGGPPSSTLTSSTPAASLFNKPIGPTTQPAGTASTLFGTATTTASKPAFQLPTATTSSTPLFGSTLNSNASGTLFGGSVTRPTTLFTPK